jgi:hypothetical protein
MLSVVSVNFLFGKGQAEREHDLSGVWYFGTEFSSDISNKYFCFRDEDANGNSIIRIIPNNSFELNIEKRLIVFYGLIWHTPIWSYDDIVEKINKNTYYIKIKFLGEIYGNKITIKNRRKDIIEIENIEKITPLIAEGIFYKINCVNPFQNEMVTIENLRIRKFSDINSTIIETIPKNTRVKVIKEGHVDFIDDKWSHWLLVFVEEKMIVGWCFGGYLMNK